MKKKVLICALVSAAALSAAAFAGCNLFGGGGNGYYRQDNMRFTLKEDGTYELDRYENAYLNDTEDDDGGIIPGYSGGGETVTVPDTVKGKAVTSVAGYAFGDTGVKEVTFPNAISVLPERLFDGCSLLEKVNTSVITNVEYRAFYKCENLKSIAFESGLTELGKAAFEGCPALTAITLPDTVTTLDDRCFWGDGLLENISTPNVEVLGEYAFYQCNSITSLAFPNIVSIGERAFSYCESLTEMTIGNKLETCETGLSNLTKVSIDSPIPANMFYWSKTLTDVTLGDGVTSIGEMAFGYCSKLMNITLPATLTGIGKSAFWESGITSVTIPATVQAIGESAFYGCKITSLTIEDGIESIGESAFESAQITSLSLPASVKSVGDKAFQNCNSLTQITFPDKLESIGKSAFAIKGAETLDIVLPTTVKNIGDGCFGGITANKIIINDTVETVGTDILMSCKVKELTAPASYGNNATEVETLTLFGEGEIPNNAYKNCAALKTVDLGGGVKKIGSNAFKAIETINLGGVEYLGYNALGDLSSLTCLTTENGVKTLDNWVISTDYSAGGATNLDLSGYTGIYNNAFAKTNMNDTSALKTVVLVGSDDTSNLKFIGENAFKGSGITAVEVPASVKEWKGAFKGCKSLSYVRIQRGVEKIADSAFTDCTNLEGLNFASTDVVEIGNSAFSGCENLRLITLPDSIKKIGESAFEYCESLMTIDLKGTEEIAAYAFRRCSSLGSVTMNSVKKICTIAFSNCKDLTEYDLPVTLTEIEIYALDCAQTVNYAGTAEQWAAITKGRLPVGNGVIADGNYIIWDGENDLTVNFADGGSMTYPKIAS